MEVSESEDVSNAAGGVSSASTPGESSRSQGPSHSSTRTSDGERSGRRSPAVLGGFVQLLGFWGDVYETHACERVFLELSSGIPFEQWQRVVTSLKRDLTTWPSTHPSSSDSVSVNGARIDGASVDGARERRVDWLQCSECDSLAVGCTCCPPPTKISTTMPA